MGTVALYLPDDLLSQLKAAAAADGRSLSNFCTLQLRTVMAMQTPEARAVKARGGQVDIEDVAGAIAGQIRRGPVRRHR